LSRAVRGDSPDARAAPGARRAQFVAAEALAAGACGEAVPAAAAALAGWAVGRYSGPFWPQAASVPAVASASAHRVKTARGARVRRAAKLGPFIRWILSSMSSPTVQDSEYNEAADRVLAAIERQADAWLQQGEIDIDTNRSGGLLELEFPDGSKIVVNKQPPLHEIWLAARNGGYHFRWVDGAWRDTRDGREFFARLSDEASVQAGKPLAWPAG